MKRGDMSERTCGGFPHARTGTSRCGRTTVSVEAKVPLRRHSFQAQHWYPCQRIISSNRKDTPHGGQTRCLTYLLGLVRSGQDLTLAEVWIDAVEHP